MKARYKILVSVVVSVVIILLILCAAFYLFGERVIKIGVETAATKSLGVGVSIDDVDLSVLGGYVEINGLVINNPPGYTYKSLLELAEGRVEVSINSLFEDTVRIREIRLDGVNLVIEQKALSNNLQDVLGSISAKGEEKPRPEGKSLVVDELEITNIRVKVKLLPVPGKADVVTLDIPPIRMSELGSERKLTMGKLSEKIILAISRGVTEQGVGVLPVDVVGTMKLTLDKTIDVGKAASDEGKKLIDVGSGLLEGLKGLLGPKKKE